MSKEEFISYIQMFETLWTSKHVEREVMVRGTIQVIKGLFKSLSNESWEEAICWQATSQVVEVSFMQIMEQCSFLMKEGEGISFFDLANCVEQIHASFSALLEVCGLFTEKDFSSICFQALPAMPKCLKPLTSCGLHSSCMTSVAGILKAAERIKGSSLRVYYGGNIYYELINALDLVSSVHTSNETKEEEWKEIDVVLSQFNPVWQPTDPGILEYKEENVFEVLHKVLDAKKGKPLTLALDCTIDFFNSPRVSALLEEFQDDIQIGALNVIFYRSGLKFDLFGMDNYCGAPFYMIHNKDPYWEPFQSLFTDSVLNTDRLSANWFCLAYREASQYIDLYRKCIFDNTKELFRKIPRRLLEDSRTQYRVTPFSLGSDPAFVDIKIFGSFHKIRASAFAGGVFTIRCMEEGVPIFNRITLGLYHTNFTMIFNEDFSSIRLTLGLDSSQIDVLVRCFEEIDALNGSTEGDVLLSVSR